MRQSQFPGPYCARYLEMSIACPFYAVMARARRAACAIPAGPGPRHLAALAGGAGGEAFRAFIDRLSEQAANGVGQLDGIDVGPDD
jgi:hypothetical protein